MIKNSVLPSTIAEEKLLKLFDTFDADKCIYKGYPTGQLFEKIGVMFGILVCRDKDGKTVVLKAFSGQFVGNWIVPTFVPPLLDVDEFDEVAKFYIPQCKALTREIEALDKIEDAEIIRQKKKQRKNLSSIALQRIVDSYKFPTITGKLLTLKEVVKNRNYPSGTGDCCAPKLFGYAFSHKLQPISLAEGFYGKNTNLKEHKKLYPPCKEKCSLVLPTMLDLDILYCDDYITVVNKPAGLVTIPGRTPELKDCITSRIKTLFPSAIDLSSAHRLDMDTSGLIVLGRDKVSHRNLSIQFQDRKVEKRYIALVRGIIKDISGTIELPLRLDIDNRPTQIVDFENGKSAKTEYTRIAVEHHNDEFATRLILKPFTGRTHQLRVHCKEKLFPIVGDRLYGVRKRNEVRMLLHAYYLSFYHPVTGERLKFEVQPEF
jgi:tRNA pseudouridine32 synthase/23S rRNA pseudouridine746 synthase